MHTISLPALLSVPLLIALNACSSNDDDTPIAISSIVWENCSDNTSLDCASIEVPIDYSTDGSETINISIRRRAADVAASPRILLLNPGGPGASGITLLNDFVRSGFFPERILRNFDIVGFDPRGVGASNAIDCTEFPELGAPAYPGTEEDIRDLITANTRTADLCFEKHGDYLQHLGTNNVVRDMDEIRKAYAIEHIDFLGYSYGSRLGAAYLQSFPNNSGAFVLDGIAHPDPSTSLIARGTVTALQRNLEQFLAGCVNVDQQCDSVLLQQQLQQRINFFVDAIDSGTLPAEFESFEALQIEANQLLNIVTSVSSDLGLADSVINPVFNYLQSNDIQFLTQLDSLFQPPLQDDANEGEDVDGGGEQSSGGPNRIATIAVQCADDAERPTFESLTILLQELNNSSDLFAEYGLLTAAICAGWPQAILPMDPIATSTAPRSLLIGGTTDTLTPIDWLAPMIEAIGGTSITSSHFGHTIAFDGGSSCVDNQVVEFLVTLAAPVDPDC